MPKPRFRSLRSLAAAEDPLAEPGALVRRLRRVTAESKYVEWKLTPPLGPAVSVRTKYRVVKGVISFANSDGGFIVFGVSPEGIWKGLSEDDLRQVDPAHITELINSCVSPDIPAMNYAEVRYRGRSFAILHVPPSDSMPHITTKAVFDPEVPGARVQLLAKYALYCRYGGKSDLATPTEHHKIIARRTESLREDLLRRIKEVPVAAPIASSSSTPSIGRTVLRVARATSDPNAQVVRVTRRPEEASGILLHEQLTDGLFDEINNVVDANSLLARGEGRFLLGEPIYYRIYAERQHVDAAPAKMALLARTGLHDFYAPFIYWCLSISSEDCGGMIRDAASSIKHPQMLNLMRLVTLLGKSASDWLFKTLERQWGLHPQPPDYFWAFKKMRSREGLTDRRLVALRAKETALVEVPASGRSFTMSELLNDQQLAAVLLSQASLAAFRGSKADRSAARLLDVAAYGLDMHQRSDPITAALFGGSR